MATANELFGYIAPQTGIDKDLVGSIAFIPSGAGPAATAVPRPSEVIGWESILRRPPHYRRRPSIRPISWRLRIRSRSIHTIGPRSNRLTAS